MANKTGRVSGAKPCIPIAVRMVYQVAHAVKVPIIGMGGVASAEDAIEMILAGASAVSVGTANFHNPAVTMEIVDGIEAYMSKNTDLRRLPIWSDWSINCDQIICDTIWKYNEI